jgi:quercetin dioxygenase-like cupin family protein
VTAGLDRRGGETGERAFLAPESAAPWEHDPPNEGDTAEIRWRTLVAADRTPTSGLSMGVFEVPPGAQLAPHHHAPQEVYYVVAGEAEVFLDGAWQPVRPGDVAYFPGGAVHGARNRGASTCRIAWVFPTDTFDEIEYRDVDGP